MEILLHFPLLFHGHKSLACSVLICSPSLCASPNFSDVPNLVLYGGSTIMKSSSVLSLAATLLVSGACRLVLGAAAPVTQWGEMEEVEQQQQYDDVMVDWEDRPVSDESAWDFSLVDFFDMDDEGAFNYTYEEIDMSDKNKIPGDNPLYLCEGDHDEDIVKITQIDLDPNPPKR